VAVTRIRWEDLPASTRRAVEKHAGPVLQAVTVSAGLNSAVAAVLTTEAGQVFAKGLRADYPRRWTQDMEALINPYVATLSPRLLWRVQDEWDMLGFELIKGSHADYAPGSPDLPAAGTPWPPSTWKVPEPRTATTRPSSKSPASLSPAASPTQPAPTARSSTRRALCPGDPGSLPA
jgi:hypothetical protein